MTREDPSAAVADPTRVAEAVSFAVAAHGDQLRKVSITPRPVPYVAHLLAVVAVVMDFGGDTDTSVAAVLHDVVEDTPVSVGEVAERFGARVAEMVQACTDTLPGDRPGAKSPWEERKQAFLARLGQAGPSVALIAVGDKLHNVTSMVEALDAHGPSVLSTFSAPPERILWYYRAVLDAVVDQIPSGLAARYAASVDRLGRALPIGDGGEAPVVGSGT